MPRPRFKLTPLNMIKTKVFLQIKKKGLLKDPQSTKTPLDRMGKSKYYHFHYDYSHNTKDY